MLAYLEQPNRAKETGVYVNSTTVTVDDTTPVGDNLLFSDFWGGASGEQIMLLIESIADTGNWKIAGATYNGVDTFTIATASIIETKGTIANGTPVYVSAVFSSQLLAALLFNHFPGGDREISGTSDTLNTNYDTGYLLRTTNGSATLITLPAVTYVAGNTKPAYIIVQEGAGTASIAVSTGTINGGAGPVALAGQYKKALVYLTGTNTWIAVV